MPSPTPIFDDILRKHHERWIAQAVEAALQGAKTVPATVTLLNIWHTGGEQ